MKTRFVKILREAWDVIAMTAASSMATTIAVSPIWWNEPTEFATRILLCSAIAFLAIYAAASLHSEYRLIVRIERRGK